MNTKKNTNGTSDGSAVPANLTPAVSSNLPTSADAGSEPLSQSDCDRILSAIADLRADLHFLRDLTAEERKSMSGMGDANRVFAGKILEVIQQNPDFLPRSFDIDDYQQKIATFDRLSKVGRALTQLNDLINATMTAIGSEIHDGSLTAYRHAKVSGFGASLEAMFADLKRRFTPKSKKKDDSKDKPETEE